MSTNPFSTATERDALCSFLDQARDALIRKIDGLSDKDARHAATVSSLSLLSLLKHSAIWGAQVVPDHLRGAKLSGRVAGSERGRGRHLRSH
jgi:hypothetical protein